MENTCLICGHPYPEEHHVVFRGQQSALISCPHNKIPLCYEHHRGKNGPHMNRKIDLKYKKQLQFRLKSLFSHKEYYTEEETKRILLIPKKDSYKLIKSLTPIIIDNQAKYHSGDIVRQAMGGRCY